VALRKLNAITDKGLDGLHSAFLKEIDLRWNELIHDQGKNDTVDLRACVLSLVGILTVVSNNLNLRSIHLVNCHSLTEQSVMYIAQNLAEKLVSCHSHVLVDNRMSTYLRSRV
jgi:hypothetical protein